MSLCDGPVAQWIRHLTTNQGIPGSSPGRVASFHFPSTFSFFSLSFFPLLKYSLFSIPNKGRKTIINPEIGRTAVIIPIFPTNQPNKLWIDRLTPSEMFPFFSFHWNFFPLTKIGPTLEKISFKKVQGRVGCATNLQYFDISVIIGGSKFLGVTWKISLKEYSIKYFPLLNISVANCILQWK